MGSWRIVSRFSFEELIGDCSIWAGVSPVAMAALIYMGFPSGTQSVLSVKVDARGNLFPYRTAAFLDLYTDVVQQVP